MFVLATAGVLACGRERGSGENAILALMLDTTSGAQSARVVVVGIDQSNLRTLRSAQWSNDTWNRLLRVSVAGGDSIPIAGRYTAGDAAVAFQPAFPFDRGRAYTVRFDPRALPRPQNDSSLISTVSLPRINAAATTQVVRVLPTTNVLPENQLRLYIEFSAPMSRDPGVDFVHLIDDSGHEVKNAFLPLEADFWNPDHTRYTVFFDPGRVKRGIRPNEQMGRALQNGHAYAILVDSTWKDGNGQPLAHSFRYEFRAGPAIEAPIALSEWKVQPPGAGTRDPLIVKFPRPLDHGLLQRALGVRMHTGEHVAGSINLAPREIEWHFTPERPWTAGAYQLVALSILEDLAGNRIGRAFEVDEFKQVDSSTAGGEHTIGFAIR